MLKVTHEVRDPIHTFIRMDTQERAIFDSRPFQRLRHIHQLALTSLVYPGATHMRFEHSLGVMGLAEQVFNVVTHREHIHDDVLDLFEPLLSEDQRRYWRRVVRLAALCHDMGHLPFSHAAEELLPVGWDHEKITVSLIMTGDVKTILETSTPPVRPIDVAKLAVGPKKFKDAPFSDWEAILSEIITGEAFGVDRIDYLLRDSYHAGVAYGNFDHNRLIDCLRILPKSYGESREPALGVDYGGLQSAEALLLARYFMYTQVYFHPVRRAFDIHLKDFLMEWLPQGKFPTDIEHHLGMTDNEVFSAIRTSAKEANSPGAAHALRIADRKHFKVLYERNPLDLKLNPEPGKAIFTAAVDKLGSAHVRRDFYTQKSNWVDFPVLARDNRVVSSLELSEVLRKLPIVAVDYILVAPELLADAKKWLVSAKEQILGAKVEED
jgi:HD superfamily phosphohydrolase